jgi:unsaturated chondroitin disaccharide hydrolase
MINIDRSLELTDLSGQLDRLWQYSAEKIRSIHGDRYDRPGTPVFTRDGKYVAHGWTEWTQGFEFGSAILQFDATGDEEFLTHWRLRTVLHMATHVTHMGVHDHGFNNVSTYGNLRRLMLEERIETNAWELHFYELALKASGAVQAARWSETADGHGFIYSFNGPHSLFCDTMRSLRSLSLAHWLAHELMGENDESISLLDRMIQHARTTAKYSVYYGDGRDAYDVRGRVAHESVFNTNDGQYRCPSTQQGYSPFTTWTRGLAWIMLGYPEQLEFVEAIEDYILEECGPRKDIETMMVEAATAACDYYLESSPTDGVPYWDTGAPGLVRMSDPAGKPADPFNEHEPVDSSAAAIAAQGLLRLGRYLRSHGRSDDGDRYWQAGLTVARTLLDEPYLSTRADHQGLLLHAVYHRPRGWDHVPAGSKVPNGESCMWGDYHLRELALYLQRVLRDQPYLAFFAPED